MLYLFEIQESRIYKTIFIIRYSWTFDFSTTKKIFIFVFYFYILPYILNALGISAMNDKIIVLSPFVGLDGQKLSTVSLLFNKMLDIISFTMGGKKRHSQKRKHT